MHCLSKATEACIQDVGWMILRGLMIGWMRCVGIDLCGFIYGLVFTCRHVSINSYVFVSEFVSISPSVNDYQSSLILLICYMYYFIYELIRTFIKTIFSNVFSSRKAFIIRLSIITFALIGNSMPCRFWKCNSSAINSSPFVNTRATWVCYVSSFTLICLEGSSEGIILDLSFISIL